MKVLGIDEAGRGAFIGPLVVAGFMIEEKRIPFLKEMGVKDSKLLSKRRRESLYDELIRIGKYEVIKTSPREIDQRFRNGMNLNQLELIKMVEIINKLKPDKAIIDSPHPIPDKFKVEIELKVNHKKCEIVCENKADYKYVIVGAGSVIAKVVRDREIEKIEREVGVELGVGYPHSEKTLEFARKAMRTGRGLIHVRKSWETYSRLKAEGEQKSIGDFK